MDGDETVDQVRRRRAMAHAVLDAIARQAGLGPIDWAGVPSGVAQLLGVPRQRVGEALAGQRTSEGRILDWAASHGVDVRIDGGHVHAATGGVDVAGDVREHAARRVERIEMEIDALAHHIGGDDRVWKVRLELRNLLRLLSL